MSPEQNQLKARLSALQDKLDRLSVSPTHDDADRLSAAQARADSVMQLFGERASNPLQSESPTAYRKRVLTSLQKHSTRFKDARLDGLYGPVLDEIEQGIYADAQAAARSGAGNTGALTEVVSTDESGRKITRYYGDINAWMQPFKSPGTSVTINNGLIKGRR